MYQIKDSVCFVTGGAAGLGAEVVRAFLQEGAKHVAILDVDVLTGKALETELRVKYGQEKVTFYKCDVTTKDLEDCYDAVVKQFGYIDCVVNNAGILNERPEVFVKEIEINLTALIRSSLKAYNLMRKDRGGKGGVIINISSVAGICQPAALPIYSATKAAVLQFSNCLGQEPHYPRSQVRVITICFGCTDTAILQDLKFRAIDKETDDDENILNTIKSLPMQKPQSAVKGLVEAFKKGASGSTWLVSADKPAKDITANITKGYEIMSQGIYDQ